MAMDADAISVLGRKWAFGLLLTVGDYFSNFALFMQEPSRQNAFASFHPHHSSHAS
jgi:hypothetical protein